MKKLFLYGFAIATLMSCGSGETKKEAATKAGEKTDQ
jgi:hypothetical protein